MYEAQIKTYILKAYGIKVKRYIYEECGSGNEFQRGKGGKKNNREPKANRRKT